MRRMKTRQAITLLTLLLPLLAGLYACSPSNQPESVLAAPFPSASPTSTLTPSPSPTATFTATPLACLTQPGRVEESSLPGSNPPQYFLIYLPPCYDQKADQRYPTLYLLHGQMSTDDQWVRLGMTGAADQLILSGESIPFIIIFPDDRYWNLPSGSDFGQRLVNQIIPYIDTNYRTLPDRNHRAIGGLSRGAGWAFHLGLTRWDLFGAMGLHSLAVFQGDDYQMKRWMENIPTAARPRIFMDLGYNDPELLMSRQVEADFNELGFSHEWHLYNGGHTEDYWSSHVDEYIEWYTEGWNNR